MSHNMSIYRRLNPRLLVQAGVGLGLLHWANISNIYIYIYISNTLPQTQDGSSMKVWGWISLRRSLGDAVKNAFEETTINNMPIHLFRSFKWRNGVQKQNLHEKLSKIGLFKNFDIRSKVNAKSQSQLVHGQSQRRVLTGQIRVVRVGLVWVNGQLGDVVLTRRHCWHG